jgi:chemotaxis protein MotB
MSGGSVKKVEPINLQDIETDTQFFDEDRQGGLDRIKESFRQAQQNSIPEPQDGALKQAAASITAAPARGLENPDSLVKNEIASVPVEDSNADKIFSLSMDNIAQLGLDNFAAIDLVPDQTMRIILTGDLLFETGRAELSQSSKASLLKIASVIREIPYMINVVGHTDNIPMHSEKYATNWELSVARASIVARFLVEEMNMNPQQFVVSGYSSFRPIRPNTNARNRAVNRRVEIIISKRLPAPLIATAENLK